MFAYTLVDRNGYRTPATFDTERGAARFLEGVKRHNADYPQDQITVEPGERQLRPVYQGGEPRGFGTASAFIRR